MLLRVCACPFHKMEIAGWGPTSLFWEMQENQGEVGAGHPAEEPPCRISLPDKAHNLADNGIATDSDFHDFWEGYVQPLSKPCCVWKGKKKKKPQVKAALLSGNMEAKWRLMMTNFLLPLSVTKLHLPCVFCWNEFIRGEALKTPPCYLPHELFWKLATLILSSCVSPIPIISRTQNHCLHNVPMGRNCSVSWSENFTFPTAC